MLAFVAAKTYLEERMPSVAAADKNVANYTIVFYTTPSYYVVEFVPNKLPGEKRMLGCYYHSGLVMDFEIRKTDYTVAKVRRCF